MLHLVKKILELKSNKMLHCIWERFYWVCFLKFGSNNSWNNLFQIFNLHLYAQSLEWLFQIHCHSFRYWHSVLVPFPFCWQSVWIGDLFIDSTSEFVCNRFLLQWNKCEPVPFVRLSRHFSSCNLILYFACESVMPSF